MAPSRRVRVSRIKYKRKILRLLPMIINRQQKGVFLLTADFWLYKARILGQEQRKVQSGRKKEEDLNKVGWCNTNQNVRYKLISFLIYVRVAHN